MEFSCDTGAARGTAAYPKGMSRAASSSGVGSAISASSGTPCQLNAGSGLRTSVLFGTNKSAKWEEGFAALEKFKAREGHCRVPEGHVEGVFMLGNWVAVQREA